MKERTCRWCKGRIPYHKRAGTMYCGRRCQNRANHARNRAKNPPPRGRQKNVGDHRQVGVLLCPELHERLEREAESRNVYLSSIVIDSLSEYFRVRDLI